MNTKHSAALFFSLLASTAAHAGSASGKVLETYVLTCPTAAAQSSCAVGIVRLSNPIAGAPSCINPALINEFAFSLETAVGRTMFSTLLHAQSMGATVVAVGDNTCGAWSDRERLNYIRVVYP